MAKPIEKKYNPVEIESRWQRIWEENKVYSPDLDRAEKPFYNLWMFPYPSGEGLHVGHFFASTGSDAYGRFARMKGYDVFQPIGYDAFGIHSENYALKTGTHPKDLIDKTTKRYESQFKEAGHGYDWTRTVNTSDSNYYKWTQWIFVEMFKAGLAYRAKARVNWCPSCKTVLSDEQVITKSKIKEQPFDFAQGKKSKIEDERIRVCERCETEVEMRDLEQWFFRITEYAEKLLADLDSMDWPERIKTIQRNWIGKSEGAVIKFKVGEKEIEVFTTRPDTLFGATFLVLSPDSSLINQITTSEHRDNVSKYIKGIKNQESGIKEKREKTGVFTGAYAINPVNNEQIPIWVADYVLSDYGSGAIMAVPAHDARDFEFAKKYDLPITRVIENQESLASPSEAGRAGIMNKELEEAYMGEGVVINSGEWNGMRTSRDIGKIILWLEGKGFATKKTHYHLRDWLISRQRYWGPPIPMIHCFSCAKKGMSWFTSQGAKRGKISNFKFQISNENSAAWNAAGWPARRASESVAGWYPEENLPVLLPYIEDYKPLGSGKSPLASDPEFYNVKCPNCGSDAKRETDVSDTFLDSSWYFLRYTSTEFDDKAFDRDRIKKWLPVDMYIGGAEHAVLHLLYSRFITMFLKDIGEISFEEPFKRFYAHGLLIKEGAKMSKSKGNVIVPDEYIKKYGADTLRCYLMFLGPFNQGGDFHDSGIEGMSRFLKRVWTLFHKIEIKEGEESREVLKILHKTIKEVSKDYENLAYNTVISKLMELYNFLSDSKTLSRETVITFLKLLAPLAPHMTEEIYQELKVENGKLKNEKFETIHKQSWTEFDKNLLIEKEVKVMVQVNGKLRGEITVQNANIKDQKYAGDEARKNEKVAKHLEGKTIKKVIYIEGRVINFVVN